ncbi:MerR family transcriptional regulator [Paenibacillus sp. ATY16]|uniref:MerR family transcriptional regulator n=1 Tax=Paenibacillus sp. ATY16 TaxID=1759312 RepID=UPI00200E6408|nr:MerR family transcriptional regulator [Paenibacillus sp. ATY16]MCK9859575.1 MerR family transcriptional regulator [Paenibacillus sp. ATY16]
MDTFTAKQVTEIIQLDDAKMNLRTVRYYTQIGILPPLELVGNKRVYTNKHVQYLRAIITLSRTGETLAAIQEKLSNLSMEEIEKIGDQINLFNPERVLESETHQITEDVAITLSPRLSEEVKQKVIESVSMLLRGDRD